MDVLFNTEHLTFSFHHHTQVHIKRRCIRWKAVVIGIFHISSSPLLILIANPFLHVLRIKILYTIEASTRINLSLQVTVAIFHYKSRYPGSLGHLGIIRTESRSNMHYASTLIRRHIVSRDNSEYPLIRTEPWNQLLIAHSHKFTSLNLRIRHYLKRNFLREQSVDQILSHNVCSGSPRIRIR